MRKIISVTVGFISILELIIILNIYFSKVLIFSQLDQGLNYGLVLIFLVGGFIAGALRVGTIKGAIVGVASGIFGIIGLIGVYTPEVAGSISLQIESLLLAPLYGLLYGIIYLLRATVSKAELQSILITVCIAGLGGLLGGALTFRTEGERNVEWLVEQGRKKRR